VECIVGETEEKIVEDAVTDDADDARKSWPT
jgi:hypothetical protein